MAKSAVVRELAHRTTNNILLTMIGYSLFSQSQPGGNFVNKQLGAIWA